MSVCTVLWEAARASTISPLLSTPVGHVGEMTIETDENHSTFFKLDYSKIRPDVSTMGDPMPTAILNGHSTGA
jgi:hypothetical protein